MKIIECPRDAMQGLEAFIPTEVKAAYLNQLLKVGFDTIDFGSFVSHKAIPQMRDTEHVLSRLDFSGSRTSLLAIIANKRGADEAASFSSISFLGFPLSVSETFQMRNTNKTIAEALDTLVSIKEVCVQRDKRLVVYLSMGFGNPYGDPYDASMIAGFVDILITLGADVISIADTVGAASPQDIATVVGPLIRSYPSTEIGVHLHSAPAHARSKIIAALEVGCKRIDGALKGYGGCPMAKDELVGNLATEQIVGVAREFGLDIGLDDAALSLALSIADEIFPKH